MLTVAAVAAVAAAVSSCAGASAPKSSAVGSSAVSQCNASNSRLVDSLRSLSNPYHAVWTSGSKAFVKSLGLPSSDYKLLLNEGDSAKQIAQVRTLLATGNDHCTAISVDPNEELGHRGDRHDGPEGRRLRHGLLEQEREPLA